MHHEPRGLLSYTQSATHFVAADPILAVDDEPCRREPLLQRYWRVLEDRPRLERELCMVMLSVTLPGPLFRDPENFVRTAAWACDLAVWPAKLYHEFAAMLK